jgi:methyl-accepting chemotaxis protein
MSTRLFGNSKAATAINADIVLDQVSANIMLADQDYTITYVNPALQQMLVGIESDLRRDLPHFDARNLVGCNIDVFHRHSERRRRLLDSLRGRHHARIEVGGRHLAFTATALDDRSGRRTGYVVEWLDVTAEARQAAVQEAVARAVQAAAHDDLTVRIPAELPSDAERSMCQATNMVLDTLQNLVVEIGHMSAEHDKGDIDVQIDVSKFQGPFRALAQGINDMVDGHIAVKKRAMVTVNAFGEADFDTPLGRFPGKKVFINDTIEELRSNLRTLIDEMNHMSAEHDKGNLHAVIDSAGFPGEFAVPAQGASTVVNGHLAAKGKAIATIKAFGDTSFDRF